MSISEENSIIYEFGAFRLDVTRRLLLKEGVSIQLTPKLFDTLRVLVERGKTGISKDELMREVWGDTIVEETNLTTNISLLRKALGEKRDEHNFIVTIPGEGYRFVADVRKAVASEVATNTALTVERDEADNEVRLSSGSRVETSRADSHKPPSSGVRKGLLFGIVGVLLVGAGVTYVWLRRSTTNPPIQIRSLAVLPFKPLVAPNRDEALELGMADTLITRLSGVEGTIVRPLSAVRRYVSPEQDALAAGRELQVETVLDGSISQVGDRIRVKVKLMRVGDGKQLWDGTFDESFTDIFSVQDRVSERVAGVLVARLNGREEEIVHKRDTANTEAYRLYLTGRYLWGKRTGDGFRQSIERYQEALKLDPNYALAYAGLADSYNFLGSAGEMRMSESHPLARAAATQALQLDDQLAEAHTSLAANIMDYYWDWPEAERHFQRAIELNQNYPTVHHLYSQYLSIMGRLDDSVAEAEKAWALDPLSLAETENVALALYRARRYAEAITLSQQVIKMDGDFVPAHIQLGLSYTQTGSYDASITELRKALELSHNNPDILGMVGYAYAAAGRRNEARKVLGELKELAHKQYVSPFDNAGVLVGLGEKDEAFTWLNKAYDERVWIMGFIKVEPVFDSLRSDQRYTELVRRIGLSVS